MIEQRQVTLAASGTGELLGTDDVSGRVSKLAAAIGEESELSLLIEADQVGVEYELTAGSRTLARGRISGGGTAGTFKGAESLPMIGPFLILPNEDISCFIRDTEGTGTPAVMASFERE